MIDKLVKTACYCFSLFITYSSFSQTQSCPLNINYSTGTLTHWFAYTGNNQQTPSNPNGNGPLAIKMTYDSTINAPVGTIGAVAIPEYNLPSVSGITVNTVSRTDPFGGFPSIPVINGFHYDYSVTLGSTSITHSTQSATGGGYIRGVSYEINVPATPATQPYTMTYAYAMVLENGAHNSNEQPLISATVKTADSIIHCASPSYYLPTLNNANNGGGATLDSAAALANGFNPSSQPSPNPDPNSNQTNPPHLYDVWTKGWTEVTFDLSAYRGQQVSLTFEADNCVPGGHFAYAYIALRNTCAGLIISGDSVACINSNTTYSIPSLTGASYSWAVPSNWTILSGGNTNIIDVHVGTQPGSIIAREQNSCANLADTIQVSSNPPTVVGNLAGNTTVCAGINSSILTLSGNTGNVMEWLASTDNGVSYTNLPVTSTSYTAQNLNATTLFEAVVQNGEGCAADTSLASVITVDQKSVGGLLSPADTAFCVGENNGGILRLTGFTGSVLNWQSSLDSLNWNYFNPVYTDSNYNFGVITASTYYRAIVKNGVCISDTSSVSSVIFYNDPYAQATGEPADTTICYGGTAQLNAIITSGTSYSWTNLVGLTNQGSGIIASTPQIINAQAKPDISSYYVLSVRNGVCPNQLNDTFHITVIPQILVNAGHDTAVVVNQPLQLQASTNDTSSDTYSWSPVTALNNPNISNPVAILGGELDSIRYMVKVTDSYGCYGENSIEVKIFKTPPDIFVPNAFTPGSAINNIFKPIPVGISSIVSFRIYNRWGQLVFSTSRIGEGWNGMFGGKPQDTGTFVWMIEGKSYNGDSIFRKGTVTLIR
jgi:gliding motility-associated-like protein